MKGKIQPWVEPLGTSPAQVVPDEPRKTAKGGRQVAEGKWAAKT